MAGYKITERTRKDKSGNVIEKYNCIIADFENMTENERQAVQMYLQAGYKLFPAKKGTTGKGLTKAKMEAYLKENDANGLKELQTKLKNKENFMKITKWFKDSFPDAVK